MIRGGPWRGAGPRGALFAALLGGVTPTAAQSDGFCTGLAQLGARLNTAAQDAAPDIDQSFALPGQQAAQAGCQRALTLGGGRSLHCMWVFAYRAEAATGAFHTLLRQTAACGADSIARDQDVNHPDVYDLRLFSFADSTVGVSLKDKGAAAQTLVFLTISASTAP